MGKNLKGKELGVGISQRSDELYVGRYTDRYGKRQTKVFRKLAECKQWLADAKYQDTHTDINNTLNVTLDTWFNYWIEIKGKELKASTIDTYTTTYKNKISPILGNTLIQDIKPINCQQVINQAGDLKTSSLRNLKRILKQILDFAVLNEVIIKNPCNKAVTANIGRKTTEKIPLTISEQRTLFEALKGNLYELHYRLVLQTGLRVGELRGLKWSDINFTSRILSVNRNVARVKGEWIITEPKTEAGKRKIPLTDEAIAILREQKERNRENKVVPIDYKDYIFLTRKGNFVLSGTYDILLYHICEINGLPNISMHILRHTFATRCIEAGMKPKTLQRILGHANIQTTMNLYVHTTEDEKIKEMEKVSKSLIANW